MLVELDKFELFYLMESCLRGSHLRTSTINKMVRTWQRMLTDRQRAALYKWILRDVYHGVFKESDRLCGSDKMLMDCLNPDNQYIVTAQNGKRKEVMQCFKHNGEYHTGDWYVTAEYITDIKKIEPPEEDD